MKYIFYSGAPNTGKTTFLHSLTTTLIARGYNLVVLDYNLSYDPIDCSRNFINIIERENVRIIINTYSDYCHHIDYLKSIINEEEIQFVISTIRDEIDPMRKYLIEKINLDINNENLSIEIPLAKITRKENNRDISLNWYKNAINKLVINLLSTGPFKIL